MHSTTGQTSSTVSLSSTSTSSTTSNIEQYHYPPISTLRRPSRPGNIDLSVFDVNNTQQSNDPGIYSAPICHLKQTNNTNHHHHHHHQQQHISQSSLLLSPHPHTATFHYQPQQQQQSQQQHIQLSSHHHQQQHNIHQYQQQAHHHQQQQQQQHILDPFSQHQHTPHTFPLQASSNHYHHYFHFPPSSQNLGTTNSSTLPAYNQLQQQQQLTLQANVTSNGHHSPLNHRNNPVSSSTTNTSQPSTPTHNNRLLAVQIQEQQQWSNPVLSPLMVKRMNEGNVVSSMHMDDDEDHSASIDALVADVDSSSHDLLDKSVNEAKITSTTPLNESRASTTSPSPHLYLRSTSHILTTPPNPLASNNHPDNHLTVGNNFQKNFSPTHSAGFELTTNNTVQMSSSSTTAAATPRTSFFTFDTNVLEQNDIKNRLNDNGIKEDSHDKMTKPLLINTDERTNTISTNGLSQDDNSNHSSTNSSSQIPSSRTLSQILKSSGERKRVSSSSPLSNDVKVSPLGSSHNNKTQINMSSLSPQQQTNRHYCTHPECAKIFANKSALAKHKLTHCQDRKHKCSKCNKGFKRLDHLHGHMLTHEEEKPHKCRVPDCNRTYCDARSLKRHIENVHQNVLAAIHEGVHEEYKNFLPETAFVRTKDLSGDFSIDSVDSNSPRSSSVDNETQTFHITQQMRSSNGNKMIPTYTFDEEKCIECQICKKSFKNGAALNGHMRLHGGFNEKQQLPLLSTETIQKKKRLTPPTNNERRLTKRKRINSPSSSNEARQRALLQHSVPIKDEEEDDIMMISSNTNNNPYQQSLYPTLPPCSDVLQHRFYDRSLSSRTRSISSSVLQPQTTPLTHYHIKNPMSVQPTTNLPKQPRKQIPFSSHLYDRNNNHHYGFDIRPNEESIHNRMNISNNPLNIPSGILRFDPLTNPQMFPNVPPMQHHEEKIRKTLSADETYKYYHHDRQSNGHSPSKHSQHYPYFRSTSNQHHPTDFPPFSVPSHSAPTLAPNIFHHILRHTNDMIAKEFYLPRTEYPNPHHSSFDEPIRFTPSTSPYTTHLYHSPSPHIVHSPGDKMPNSASSVINTPVTSPYSNMNTSRCSPVSSSDMCSNTSTPIINSMQRSPLTNPVLSHAAPKKRILNALKQEAQDEQQQQQQHNQMIHDYLPTTSTIIEHDKQPILEDPIPSFTLKIVPDIDSPTIETAKKLTSGFLIETPSSSTGTSSSTSSSSSNAHFNYENLALPIPSKIPEKNNNGSFQWPSQISQFRRQQSLNMMSQTTPNPLPSTPYTPPPMLSPFRKGPGLYYHVFSQTTPAAQKTSTAATPVLPFTPVADDISGAKINIGREYQAVIPKLQMKNENDDTEDSDELLFSSSQLPYLDEKSLEKYEQLSRTNPLLFSPRHSPTLYPIELVYMLLHEYNGDLQRTLAALLDGTAHDIKQCRPLHRYHFPECDIWTNEEIDAFTKAMEISERNFQSISRTVGTKTMKECIEFHYMPKVNLTTRPMLSTSGSTAKRKRLQMLKTKQLKLIRDQYDDETSSSSFNDEDGITMNSDSCITAHFYCDIDECSQTFTSERAYRAHRNDHRRVKNNVTPPTNTKRNRNIDLTK